MKQNNLMILKDSYSSMANKIYKAFELLMKSKNVKSYVYSDYRVSPLDSSMSIELHWSGNGIDEYAVASYFENKFYGVTTSESWGRDWDHNLSIHVDEKRCSESETDGEKGDIMVKENDDFIGRGRTQEGNIDYNYWYKFDKKIPHVMRFKEFHIIDDHILYWITQEYFDEMDVRHFFDVFEDFHSNLDTAFVICRDETSWNYEKDLKDGTGAFMTLEDGYTMWNESIEVKEEVKVPGTNVVLEKGDKIHIVNSKFNKKDESSNKQAILKASNFEFYAIDDAYYVDIKNNPYNMRVEIFEENGHHFLDIDFGKRRWLYDKPQYTSLQSYVDAVSELSKFMDKVSSYLYRLVF